ncbi:MAG: hypothetical protein BGO49_31335 [Planctomycetales bacterium 71-10]|nr:MAG: hypothetical protein BGO49_31335 [Planctomycetales bacterium 71-10]
MRTTWTNRDESRFARASLAYCAGATRARSRRMRRPRACRSTWQAFRTPSGSGAAGTCTMTSTTAGGATTSAGGGGGGATTSAGAGGGAGVARRTIASESERRAWSDRADGFKIVRR